MNPWSLRRKTLILFITLFAFVVLFLIPGYFLFFSSKPDCTNGIKDGDESGIDCGGGCTLICTPEVLPLISRGDVRLLKIASSTYETAILIDNPNNDGSVLRAPYKVSIFSGASRTPVKVFERETFIGRNTSFALFEGPFTLEGEGPFRAMFEWGEDLVWEKSNAPVPKIFVESTNILSSDSLGPRLEARIINRGEKEENNVEVVALLYDENDNIIAAGKTFVDVLEPLVSTPIVFSWPEAFATEPVSVRIFPHPLPDKSFLR